MQVEYEDLPQTVAPAGLVASDQAEPVDTPGEGSEAEDDNEEVEGEPEAGEEEVEEEEEEEEETPAQEEVKKKQPRQSKQRQSLAAKERGTTIFPLSRVKRIIKADKDLDMMSNEAVFMISVATEYFIQHFMEEGYTKATLDKRKIVNYKDMAHVVERNYEFDFLRDVIPMPIPMSEALLRRQQMQDAELEDDDMAQEDLPPSDDLPQLVPSKNPLFPNAVVKKPPNTHAKTAVGKAKPAAKEPSTPKVVTGKNAPSTPHSLSTRRSARKSMNAAETELMNVDNDEEAAAAGESEAAPIKVDDEVVETEEQANGVEAGDEPTEAAAV